MRFTRFLAKNYVNLRSWSTDRKIIVIESDDWGSLRIRDKAAYDFMLKKGIPVDKNYFTRNDTLEREEDLMFLMEVLSTVKDRNNRCPILTCNSLVANPNFARIREDDFACYSYESVQESYKQSGFSSSVLSIFAQCIKDNVFLKPQFHGREHLNVRKWLKNLRNGLSYDIISFGLRSVLGLPQGSRIYSRKFYQADNYMAGFEALDKSHEKEIEAITTDGLQLFSKTFGFKSKSFAAQSLIWGDHLNETLRDSGVVYLQGAQQLHPLGNGRLKVKNRFTGMRNALGQMLWRRNASFEPSSDQNKDWVDSCLAEIALAFYWNTPAIINSHRVNFMGGINPENRGKNLALFRSLLKEIVRRWPEVEFLTSDELGEIMSSS